MNYSELSKDFYTADFSHVEAFPFAKAEQPPQGVTMPIGRMTMAQRDRLPQELKQQPINKRTVATSPPPAKEVVPYAAKQGLKAGAQATVPSPSPTRLAAKGDLFTPTLLDFYKDVDV